MPGKTLALVVVLLAFACCGPSEPDRRQPSPSPTDTPESVRKAEAERSEAARTQAIKDCAKAYVESQYAGWSLLGLNLNLTEISNVNMELQIVTADISKGSERQTVYLAAMPFTNSREEKYWKIEPFTPQLRRLMFPCSDSRDADASKSDDDDDNSGK